MMQPFQPVPTCSNLFDGGWNAPKAQFSAGYSHPVPTVPTYFYIFYIKETQMGSDAGCASIPIEKSQIRLERLEHSPNLLELREKKRSILSGEGLERHNLDLEPDYDLSGLDPNDTAAFWQEALTTDRATLRTRWPAYKGKVPDALARDIVEGCNAR